jgi:hypothetical protein
MMNIFHILSIVFVSMDFAKCSTTKTQYYYDISLGDYVEVDFMSEDGDVATLQAFKSQKNPLIYYSVGKPRLSKSQREPNHHNSFFELDSNVFSVHVETLTDMHRNLIEKHVRLQQKLKNSNDLIQIDQIVPTKFECSLNKVNVTHINDGETLRG